MITIENLHLLAATGHNKQSSESNHSASKLVEVVRHNRSPEINHPIVFHVFDSC